MLIKHRVSICSIVRLKALYDDVSGPIEQQTGTMSGIQYPQAVQSKPGKSLDDIGLEECLNKSYDHLLTFFLWPVNGVDIALWSGLEINLAIICGSIPALKAFTSHIVFGRGESRPSDYGRTNNSASRKHSHILRSGSEEEVSKMDRMQITVRESIEMKRFDHGSDEGSEKNLVVDAPKDTYAPYARNQVTIDAGASLAKRSTMVWSVSSEQGYRQKCIYKFGFQKKNCTEN